MSGRTMLVIGSQCAALNRLSFLPTVVHDLAAVLTDPGAGGCTPVLESGPVLLDRSAAELDSAIEQAFRTAADDGSTLVLSFVGHGAVVDDDFYLMATDSPATPNSRGAFLLGQRLKELLREYSAMDGLILLLDTCGSGVAADRAGSQWVETVRQSGQRFELLTATGDGPAAGGCFTKNLVYLVRNGRTQPVERLGSAHLRDPINELCPRQVATGMAYYGGAPLPSGDSALWIARNVDADWLRSPLAGTAYVDEALRLTCHYHPTAALDDLRALIDSGVRCVAVTGAAHTGKSTLLAVLARPDLTEARHRPHAAVFLGADGTIDRFAGDIADQLIRTVPDFADSARRFRDAASEAEWLAADALERLVLGPLRDRGGDADPVRLVVDAGDLSGLERLIEPDPAMAVQVVIASGKIAEPVQHMSVLVVSGARHEDLEAYATGRGMSDQDAEELARSASGNWLVATLQADRWVQQPGDHRALSADLSATYHAVLRRAGAMTTASPAAPVLAVLAATEQPLPLPLLCLASGKLDGPGTAAQVHDVLVRLDTLTSRARAGTERETASLMHPTVASYLRGHRIGGIDANQAHRALADAIAELAPMAEHHPDDPCHHYAAVAEAEHLWRIGAFEAAVLSVERRSSNIPADNRARWGRWSRRIAEELGANSSLAIRSRAWLGRWTAEAGDRAGALDLLRGLLPDSERELGRTDRQTLIVREHIAFWSGLDDPHSGLSQFRDLVSDCTDRLGADDELTLMARHHLALMFSKCGRHAEAIALWEEVLPSRERVLGATHLDTLRTQQNLLYDRAENGYPPPVAFSYPQLVTTLLDTYGEDHPETITARYHAALFLAKTMESTNIRQALAEFQALLPEAVRVFGERNRVPDGIRTQLAFWPQYLSAP
ncbi:hypothetical protein CFN78_16400 [Amycolatopsis antarctica]|uniref:Peptidase C14 caspase domain-containing protein n=1 Tax=Amycolatopsis antarctica TaxID=1854586 RepID=A0A263D104_9PSEU|nr:tetratricopeptide repeat protein [Amycolatopsis antarctica]OZM72120.1 hypothetical protein CFN78_16400 [Amycolatopsis antarctica]